MTSAIYSSVFAKCVNIVYTTCMLRNVSRFKIYRAKMDVVVNQGERQTPPEPDKQPEKFVVNGPTQIFNRFGETWILGETRTPTNFLDYCIRNENQDVDAFVLFMLFVFH